MNTEILDITSFPLRLSRLRMEKGVSAREMSLALGQNPAYINNIESGKALPRMDKFFYICEYLDVTPQEFFDTGNHHPQRLNELLIEAERLDDHRLDHLLALARDLNSTR